MTDANRILREQARSARREMSDESRARASEIIASKFASSRHFFASTLIGCYLPMHDEVDTKNIIQRAWRANKRIFVPIVRNKQEIFFRELTPNTTLRRNELMIWEPTSGTYIDAKNLQVVVTPTVAFDNKNHRIGMGGGYYDRCFSYLQRRRFWRKPKLVGIAFKCQKVSEITPNTWDVALSTVLHEKK